MWRLMFGVFRLECEEWSDGIAFGDDCNNLRNGYHNSILYS